MSQATFNVMPTATVGLRRMVQFAQVFAEPEIVATLSRQLSWSQFANLLPLKTEQARQFYANQAASQTWSVRELGQQIDRKAFERTDLASLQAPTTVRAEPVEASPTVQATSPAQVFKDPYFLDFLGLRQGHDEADLEAAILRQLEAFILELGRGFVFVERQKRMVIDGEDFYLTSDKVKMRTMKDNKGAGVPRGCATGCGAYARKLGGREGRGAGVFYVTATRATQRLAMGVGGQGKIGTRLLIQRQNTAKKE